MLKEQSPEMRRFLLRVILYLSLFALFCVTMGLLRPIINPQGTNLETVRAWIEQIRPEVDTFVNREGIRVDVSAYTGMGGAIAVYGEIRSEDDIRRVRDSILALDPPRPISWSFRDLASEKYYNGNDPVLPEVRATVGPGKFPSELKLVGDPKIGRVRLQHEPSNDGIGSAK